MKPQQGRTARYILWALGFPLALWLAAALADAFSGGASLSRVLFFLTQPLVWRFRFVDWWTVLFVLLCGTALAMLIWKRKQENRPEEIDEENMEDFAE